MVRVANASLLNEGSSIPLPALFSEETQISEEDSIEYVEYKHSSFHQAF